MKTMILVAALTLGAASAYAGEANNEPFPVPNAATVTVSTQGFGRDTGSQALPGYATRGGVLVAGRQISQPIASEAEVQTANSLPGGHADGAIAYAQAYGLQNRG